MAFTPDFLDELRSRLPVSGIVGRKVKLIKRGREFSGLCPFHNEKTPSFTVNDDKGFYHCFGCGAHGDVITFVTETEGLSFPEAVERLAEQAGMQVPKASPEEAERSKKRADLYEVIEEVARWFEEQLAGPAGLGARDYVAKRGLREDTVRRFRLGYAPDQRGLLRKAMHARGIADDQLVDIGVIKRADDPEGAGPAKTGDAAFRDFFINRLMFPITDRRGRIIAFGGRALGESRAKYLNSPDTILFHKGRILYNLSYARQAAHDLGEVVVTEGYMDVIALAQAGFPAAVAPLGTALTEDQIQELWRMVAEPIICLDGDQAGIRASHRAVERALPILQPGKSLRFATLPEGEDPDSLIQEQGTEAMREVLVGAKPLSDVLWHKVVDGQNLDTPERRAALKAELRNLVSEITDKDLRFEYQKEMYRRYDELTGYAPQQASSPGNSGGGYQSGGYQRGGYQQGGWKSKRFSGRGSGRGGKWGAPEGFVQNPRLARPNPKPGAVLSSVKEKLLIAALINHPSVLLRHVEDLATLRLPSKVLDNALQDLVDAIARDPDLDREALKCQLCDKGYSGLLEELLSPTVLDHGKFARPATDSVAAEAGVTHVVSLFREEQARREEAAVAQGFAEDMSETGLAQLEAHKQLRQEAAGTAIDLDSWDLDSFDDNQ